MSRVHIVHDNTKNVRQMAASEREHQSVIVTKCKYSEGHLALYQQDFFCCVWILDGCEMLCEMNSVLNSLYLMAIARVEYTRQSS